VRAEPGRPPEYNGEDDRCLIYSFLSNNMSGFEEAKERRSHAGADCEIEIYDHTARPSWRPPASPRLRLNRLGISAAGSSSSPVLLPYAALLEPHLQGARTLGERDADRLPLALRAAGYVMTHTEVNYNGALNFNEYSFLHLDSRAMA
jgi:hypothetical protein